MAASEPVTVLDPVCGMKIDPANAAGSSVHNGQTTNFCSTHCKTKFDTNPAAYTREAKPLVAVTPGPAGTTYVCPMDSEVRQDRPGAPGHNGHTCQIA